MGVARVLSCAEELHLLTNCFSIAAKRTEDDCKVSSLAQSKNYSTSGLLQCHMQNAAQSFTGLCFQHEDISTLIT